MKRKLFTLMTLLLCVCTGAWAEDITISPTLLVNQTKSTYGLFTISHSSTAASSGSKISSSAITTGTNGDVITINFKTTKSDMYIKSVTFNSLSNGTLSSGDGTIKSNVLTVTGNKNDIDVVLTSASGKKGSVKITNVVVNTGSNKVETLSFSSVTSGTVSFTSKYNGLSFTSAISSITSNGSLSLSEGILSWQSGKTLVFNSSYNITYIALLTGDDKFYTNSGLSTSPDTYADSSWSGTAKSVTFTNGTGGGRSLKNAFVITTRPIHSITLHDNNGGVANGSANAIEGSNKLTEISAPTNAGYSVVGYYQEAGCTHKIADASGNLQASTDYTNASSQWTSTSDDITLYAKWLTAITPSLSYDNSTLALTVLTTANPTLTGNTGGGEVTYSSSNTGVATVDPSTGKVTAVAAGTTTITASIAESGDYAPGEATTTIKVGSAPAGMIDQKLATGDVAWDASVIVTEDYTNVSGLTTLSQHGSATASGNGNTSNGGQTSKIGTASGAFNDANYLELSFTIADGKQLNVSSVAIPVQPVSSDTNNFKAVLSDNNGSSNIEGTKTNVANGKQANIDFASYGSLKGTVTLRIYAWGWTNGYRLGKNIVIDGTITDIPAEPSDPVEVGETVTLTTSTNMAGWRAFYDASQDYTLDANTKAYVVTAKSGTGGEVELTALDVTAIPHGEAVILKTTDPGYSMTLTKTTGVATLGTNLLAVTNGTANVDGYRLGYGNIGGEDAVGFFKYVATSPAAGIVYIDKSNVNLGSGDAHGLAIIFADEDVTGIETLNAERSFTTPRKVMKDGRIVVETNEGTFSLTGTRVK